MSFVNFSTKEITSKVVYYGPGLCGKTTTLQYIYDSIVPENKGQIVSLATDVDRTIYFDFLPLRLGKIQNFAVRIQLYTVPGQVRYNSTRKLVLSGTDGVVFVADSQRDLMEENLKSLKNLNDNLKEHGLSLQTLPHVFQFNKRDLPNLAATADLDQALNLHRTAWFETCATTGEGVLEALKTISKLVMQDLNRKGVVSRKNVRAHQIRTRTDSIVRPLVGLGLEEAGMGVTNAVLDDFFEPLTRDTSLGNTATALPVAPRVEAAAPARAREDALHIASFSSAFPDPAISARMSVLEERIHAGDHAVIQKQAKELFYTLIEDDRFFPPDMTESSRISMLGISLRKYAHFYRLLSQGSLRPIECLFLVHFLVDVHFSKGMP